MDIAKATKFSDSNRCGVVPMVSVAENVNQSEFSNYPATSMEKYQQYTDDKPGGV